VCFLLGLATAGLLTGLLEGVSGREGSFGVVIASMVSRDTALEVEPPSGFLGEWLPTLEGIGLEYPCRSLDARGQVSTTGYPYRRSRRQTGNSPTGLPERDRSEGLGGCISGGKRSDYPLGYLLDYPLFPMVS
jgi:hypothetical protein